VPSCADRAPTPPRDPLRLVLEDGTRRELRDGVWRAATAPSEGAENLSLDLLEAKAPRNDDPRPCGGGWMRSESTGRHVRKTCKSWLCPSCNVWLRAGASKRIAIGASDRPAGFDAAFLTFTEPARATLDLPGFYRRWEATRKRLRRRGWITEYALAVEFQGRGALHAHVVAWVPNELVPLLRPWRAEKRDRRQYAWWVEELRPLAVDLGWGQVVDAAAADTFTELGQYAVKSLGRYATKEAHAKFKLAGATRVRPVRFSGGFTTERLRHFQQGEHADPGPFVDVAEFGPCT
jgi:hypothetical protein